MIPTVAVHLPGSRPQISTIGFARGQVRVRAQQLVLQVEQLQQSMEWQGQDVEGR